MVYVCWLGRSDLHWSHVRMLPVSLLCPVAERDASYFHFHLPLSLPEDACRSTMWNVKEIILCEKKTVCTVLGISSSGWGFERRLVTVETSIFEAHCCFLSVLHQPLVLALLCVAPPPVVLLEQGRHQPHVLNVKTSIPRPPYSRSLQNVCSDRRWVSTTSNTFAFVR